MSLRSRHSLLTQHTCCNAFMMRNSCKTLPWTTFTLPLLAHSGRQMKTSAQRLTIKLCQSRAIFLRLSPRPPVTRGRWPAFGRAEGCLGCEGCGNLGEEIGARDEAVIIEDKCVNGLGGTDAQLDMRSHGAATDVHLAHVDLGSKHPGDLGEGL